MLELDPAERRELAGDESEAEVLLPPVPRARRRASGDSPSTAARHGLDVFFRRGAAAAIAERATPPPPSCWRWRGELWLRLGRGEVQGQELFRASRWVEDTAVDVRALAAEGNLEIVEALRPTGVAEIVEEWARAGSSPTVEEWLAEYVTPAMP